MAADWSSVDPDALSPASKKLYDKYIAEVNEAKETAEKLKDKLNSEWDSQYPNGTSNGLFASFNVINGAVLCAMSERKAKGTKKPATFNPFAQTREGKHS